MSFIQPSADANDQQIATIAAINQLLSRLHPRVAEVPAKWDALSAVFACRREGSQTVCRRGDGLFYSIAHGAFSVDMSEDDLRAAAATVVDAGATVVEAAGGSKAFEQAVIVVTYRRDTQRMSEFFYWNEDAEPYLVSDGNTGPSLGAVAALCDLFAAAQ